MRRQLQQDIEEVRNQYAMQDDRSGPSPGFHDEHPADAHPQVTMEEVEKYIADVDKDGSGTIDFQEFTTAFTNLMRGGSAQKK